MTKDEKKQRETEKLVLVSEIAPKSKKINEQEFDELNEKAFKKLMKDKKNIEFKEFMKSVDMFNPDDFGQIRNLAKVMRRLILILFIIICQIKNERDEAQSKLRAYQDASKP